MKYSPEGEAPTPTVAQEPVVPQNVVYGEFRLR